MNMYKEFISIYKHLRDVYILPNKTKADVLIVILATDHISATIHTNKK